jgi:precorrin-2 dehydrogenase/sirohydrochlorin ferrochelatase
MKEGITVSDWYPVLLKVEGRKCVVFGGGYVAQRKTEGLLQARADVRLISPQLTPELRAWAEAGRLLWTEREAEEGDLEGAMLAFAATDKPDTNQFLAEAARKRGIPINIANDGEAGEFILPAVLRRGGLVLTASASGAGPALATRIIDELAERYGPEYNENIEALRTIRGIVKAEVANPSERRALLQAAVTDEALEEWRSSPRLQDNADLIARLRQRANDRKG